MSKVHPKNYMAQRQRYTTLDGLRGVAALVVVLFHTGHRLGTWTPRFGYLAVDLFFLLSGFVLAHSYEPQFRNGLTTNSFLIARIVRLYPLYFLGLVLGALVALLNLDLPNLTPEGDAVSFCFGLFGLPSDVVPHGPHIQYIFAVNPPFWSLFLEFWIANIIFAVFRKYLGWRFLMIIVFVSGLGLIVSEKLFYSLDVGPDWHTFASGFARVGFSFFYGVAIARIYTLCSPKLKLPSWIFMLILLFLLSPPPTGPSGVAQV